jgi:hypothetical protein
MERKFTATERFLNGPEQGDEAGLAIEPTNENEIKFDYFNKLILYKKKSKNC